MQFKALMAAAVWFTAAVLTAAPALAQYGPAPANQAALDAWSKTSPLTRAMKPGDPRSPVFHIGSTGPKYDVNTHKEAIENLAKYTGTKFAGPITIEKLDPWAKFDGRDVRIGLAKTTLGGKPGVLFALIGKLPGNETLGVWAVDMPAETYQEWGGAIRMLALRGVIDDATIFPPDMHRQIAAQSHARQLKFYEAALDKLYVRLAKQQVLSQAQVVLRMQELNYDLLFGNDISSPFIAD